MLSIQGIQFSYPNHMVLRGISFDLPKGKLLAVLGVNGAGKTTMLKCLNRILRPQKGVVLLEGQDLLRMKGNEIARRVGYVPQRYGEERLIVFEAVLLGRRPHLRWAPTQHDFEVVEEALKLLHLEHLAMRPLNELSGGEVQKVILARALAQEPQILLLDEPVSNLDLRNQLEVMGLIDAIIRSRGLSAILSLHDLNLALRFADTFLFLKEGHIHALVGRREITPDLIHEVYGVSVLLQEVEGVPVMIPRNGEEFWKSPRSKPCCTDSLS
jgi:iron complex transport system ATP-binding protein